MPYYSHKQASVRLAEAEIGDEVLRATGAGAIAQTIDFDRPGKVMQVELHLSAASAAEDFSISVDSAAGTEYDTVLFSQDLDGLTDISVTDSFLIAEGDSLSIAFPNTNAATFGLVVHYAV